MGIAEWPGAAADPDDEGLAQNARIREIAWCGRTVAEGERVFESAAHAVMVLYDYNGIGICKQCGECLIKLLTSGLPSEG